MKFTIKDLEAFNLHHNSKEDIEECLKIFEDDKFYLTPIDKYFQGNLTSGQDLAKKFKLLFADEMFSS